MSGHGKIKSHNAQSTVEYILLVAGILAAFLVFLSSNGIFQGVLNTTYNSNINSMLGMGERILQ